MTNPYAPQLPADRLWLERAVLIGDSLSQIAFGAPSALVSPLAFRF